MFCTKCGMKNDDDALFCAGCGSQMKKVQEAPSAATNVEPVVNNVNEQKAADVKADEPVKEDASINDVGFSFFQQVEKPVEKENTESQPEVQSEVVESQFSSQSETVQPQFNGQPQFNAQPQFNGQPQFNAQPQFNNAPQKNKGKFSIKRFIFSALLIIAALVSASSIALEFVNTEMKAKYEDDSFNEDEDFKGYEIIKDGLGEKNDETEFDDVYAAEKTLRIFVIALAICLIVFAVVELVLLVAVRKRWAYVLSLLFSMINLGLAGFVTYQWCFKIFNLVKKLYSNMGFTFDVEFSAGVGIGLILIMVCQGLAFVFSIILMTCKNKKSKCL